MSSTALISVPRTDLAPPPRALALRANTFRAWLENAKPGDRIEYHRGFLPLDRDRGVSPLGEKRRRELVSISARAAALADAGDVLLVQRRHGDCDYSYVAIQPKRQSRDEHNQHNRGSR